MPGRHNRDGYMRNMFESQVVTRTELEWNRVIFYCQHLSAPFPARIWIPPFASPFIQYQSVDAYEIGQTIPSRTSLPVRCCSP